MFMSDLFKLRIMHPNNFGLIMQNDQFEQKDQTSTMEPPKVIEAIVTETERMPMDDGKFRPSTPILEDAREDRVLSPDPMSSASTTASPRPSVDIGKPVASSSPIPSNQMPAEIKTSQSPTPASKTDESKLPATSSQSQKVDEPKAAEASSPPQNADKPKETEAEPKAAIKTFTTDKGKSKVTGKTITGWI